METAFLGLPEILDIHRDQLERYGGEPGLVELELLTAALDAPAAGLGRIYLHQGPWEMAAAYLYYLVNLHPFVHCNLRVALAASSVFLELNGFELQAGRADLERLVLRVHQGRAGKAEAAEFFRRNSVRKEP